MVLKSKRLVAILLFLSLIHISPARADDYVPVTMSNVVKILVRFGVLDIRKDDVIDFYGKITECKIFVANYLDDFKWNRVRGALRQSIKQNIATFPTGVHYDAQLQLGKYDFQNKIYRFSEKTAQFNANVFTVRIHDSNFCSSDTPNILPNDYRFVLDQPILISGLPMNEAEGSALLKRLHEANNKDLIIYTRFNMRVTYIAPIEAVGADRGEETTGFVLDPKLRGSVRIDTRLETIEYFEDPERTKLIYRFTL